MALSKKAQAAVQALDTMPVADPEAAHDDADRIILDLVPPEVKAAYERLVKRAPWWASA